MSHTSLLPYISTSSILSKRDLVYEIKTKRRDPQMIADKYGLMASDVWELIDQYAVSDVKPDADGLTKEQIEIIDGVVMVMGVQPSDGRIQINLVNKGRYCNWLKRELASVGCYVDGRGPIGRREHSLRTLHLPHVANYSKKSLGRLSEPAVRRLTPLGLSVWYSCTSQPHTGQIGLNASSIGQRYIATAQEYLKTWGLEFTLSEAKMPSENNDPTSYLLLKNECRERFYDLVKYYLNPAELNIPPEFSDHIVYLAGGMQAAPDGGTTWRRQIKPMLAAKGYYCIDPTQEEPYLDLPKGWQNEADTNLNGFRESFRRIIHADLKGIADARHVICMYDKYLGGGSFHEVGHCYLTQKNLWLLNLEKRKNSELNWWSITCSSGVVTSMEQMMAILPDLSETPSHKRYTKWKYGAAT